jgi:hypothetical protein
VRHAVDQVKAPRKLPEGALEAEQADHAVDVQGEYGPLVGCDLVSVARRVVLEELPAAGDAKL